MNPLRVFASLSLLLAALAFVGGSRPRAAISAEAAPALPAPLQYVPPDAAFFIHADVAKLWNSSIARSIQAADPKALGELKAITKGMFGATPDSLKSVTLFWPKFKGPQDVRAFAIVLVFKAPFDKTKLKAGLDKLIPQANKASLLTPSDTMAVWLLGLDPAKYGKPQSANQTGPQSAALRTAAEGHLLVASSNMSQLPDEIRRDDLPPQARPFIPLLLAQTITGILDLDKELKLEVRVKASSPPRAREAEKSLGFLAEMFRSQLGMVIKELNQDKKSEPALKEVLAILEAFDAGLKNAKFGTEGEVAKATARVTADLPFGSAFVTGKRKVQTASARVQAQNNLKQIVLALHNYYDATGSMPPAAVCDKTGKPMLSWRVLILPYVEQNALYKQFKLDEPWDSENNKKLIAKMPKIFTVPIPSKAKANETHYRLFVGNGAGFDYLKGPKFNEITDGTSNTLAVVTAKDPVIWTKPDELAFEPEKDMTKLLGFLFNETCPAAMFDGSVRSLSKKLSKKTLHSAITKNGGEVLGDDF